MKTKKSISPLIAWILLVGLTVTMGVLVSNYIIKQTRETVSNLEKDSEIYCPDAGFSVDNPEVVDLTTQIKIIEANITNRGNFKIVNFSITIKDSRGLRTLKQDEYEWTALSDPNEKFIEIMPGKKAKLRIAVNYGSDDPCAEGFTSKLDEILINPIIFVADKNILCNEKVFKLSETILDNILKNYCPKVEV